MTPTQRDGSSKSDSLARRKHTRALIEVLRRLRGSIRKDEAGDYFYDRTSTISIHALLKKDVALPQREILWQWYRYFELDRGESIYQQIPPMRDGVFLQILDRCEFAWDRESVLARGLLFLPMHEQALFLALQEIFLARIETMENYSIATLRRLLAPKTSWTADILEKLTWKVKQAPVDGEARQNLYRLFGSDYLRATARQVLHGITREAFWAAPPPQFEAVEARLLRFVRTMNGHAHALGVHVSRREFLARYDSQSRVDPRKMRYGGQFSVLGVAPTASLAEVKQAYRELVKQHHPDRGGTAGRFLVLQQAYETLLQECFPTNPDR